jgi:hypothetical protein
LTQWLDGQRGVADESTIIRSLGQPDLIGTDASNQRFVFYFYDRFSTQDWFACAVMNGGKLVYFSYLDRANMGRLELELKAPTSDHITTQPATHPIQANQR